MKPKKWGFGVHGSIVQTRANLNIFNDRKKNPLTQEGEGKLLEYHILRIT